MRRIFTFLLASCLVGGSYSFAQTSGGGKIKYGIKAGVNFGSFGYDSDTKKAIEEDGTEIKSLTSFHIGGYADYAFSDAFSLQAGLTLNGKGGKETWSEDGDSWESKTNIMYLEIPVNAVYKTGGFYVGAGPYFGFALSGKVTETDEEDVDLKFGSGDDDHLKGTDFGVNFLAGYQLKNNINIGVGYGLGLSNLVPKQVANESVKNRVFSVSVGYSF